VRRQAQRDAALDWEELKMPGIQSGVALRLPPHSKENLSKNGLFYLD